MKLKPVRRNVKINKAKATKNQLVDMRKRLFLSIAIFLISIVPIGQTVQMATASNPMFSTQIQSPTNTTYSTGLINLETITVCLIESNIYYTTTYSLDGKENIPIPLTAEPHEKSFQTTMKGLAIYLYYLQALTA